MTLAQAAAPVTTSIFSVIKGKNLFPFLLQVSLFLFFFRFHDCSSGWSADWVLLPSPVVLFVLGFKEDLLSSLTTSSFPFVSPEKVGRINHSYKDVS